MLFTTNIFSTLTYSIATLFHINFHWRKEQQKKNQILKGDEAVMGKQEQKEMKLCTCQSSMEGIQKMQPVQ